LKKIKPVKKRVKDKKHNIFLKPGFGALALGIIFFATFVLINNNDRNSNIVINSEAANITTCTTPIGAGICEITSSAKNGGTFVAGHCPGATDIQCLVPKGGSATGVGDSCDPPQGKGTCQLTSTNANGGTFVPEFCPGAANVQCLVPKSASGGTTTNTTTNTTVSGGGVGVTGIGEACTAPQGSGKCELTSSPKNGGTFVANVGCPGPVNEQCLVPANSNSGGAAGSDAGCTARGGTCSSTPIANRTAVADLCLSNPSPSYLCYVPNFTGPILCAIHDNAHVTSSNTCVCNTGDVGDPQTGCTPFIGPVVRSVAFVCSGGTGASCNGAPVSQSSPNLLSLSASSLQQFILTIQQYLDSL
jgi:hypothetical protein